MNNAIFVIELLAAGVVGVLAFVLLLSGASSKEIGGSSKPMRRLHTKGDSTGKHGR